MTVSDFWTRVECLCLLYDASVTSGPRTKKRNKSVGGAKRSRHMLRYGRAADLVPDDMSLLPELEAAAWKLGFSFVLNEGDHLHLQSDGPPSA